VTQPEPNYNLLDKFLVMIEANDIDAIICFNKIDILSKEKVEVINVKNPINEQLEVKIATQILGANYLLTDIFGRLLMSGTFKLTVNQIDTDNLEKGIYLLNISKSNFNQTLKLVKN
jgi:50S ribosomal subunit-associated GTPase HflX